MSQTQTRSAEHGLHLLRSVPHHKEVVLVFGLPTTTVVIIFGIPALWVIYTLVFVFLSRRWGAEDAADGAPGPLTDGPGGPTGTVTPTHGSGDRS
ncbi:MULTISPECIES: hypothetical protein [Brevibacterium]|uniref:Uncharacterized protein n=1 Tax=Brevibacterium casei TaxID=33889 RepID=A0A7T4DK15_9MICO|nr:MULTISPECIES: hypothetical protein [Brevibacterium]QQB16222.1 hypothetical protein I6H47_09260 [Brevibacterium casei]